MKPVFADTLYWLALVKPGDQWRFAAISAKRSLGHCLVITTDEVLTEFLNAMCKFGPAFREKAVQTVEQIMNNANVRVLPQTRASFLQALGRYKGRPDKEYSLVDCALMNAMDSEDVREVLTHDHHFEQDGYTILIRENARA